jgi:hypothetical protein
VDGNVDCAGQVQCEISDDPFVAILGNVGYAVAWGDANCLNLRGESCSIGGNFAPCAPVHLAIADGAEGCCVRAGLRGTDKIFGNGLRQHRHDRHNDVTVA